MGTIDYNNVREKLSGLQKRSYLGDVLKDIDEKINFYENAKREFKTGEHVKPGINDYPAIKEHLDKFWDKISVRDEYGKTRYKLSGIKFPKVFT